MNGLSVRQQNDPQIPALHFWYWSPTANAAILLNDFFHRMVNDVLNPLQPDQGTIRTLPHGMEILSEFHKQQSIRCYNLMKSRQLRVAQGHGSNRRAFPIPLGRALVGVSHAQHGRFIKRLAIIKYYLPVPLFLWGVRLLGFVT